MRCVPNCAYEGPTLFGKETDRRWRVEYRAFPYMRDMPDALLRQRFRDIFRNFMTINTAGKSSPIHPSDRWHGYWRLRFNHVIDEFEHRFGPYPAGFEEEDGSIWWPDPRSARQIAGRQAGVGRTFEEGKQLFKYGKRAHIEAMLRHGAVRVSPASFFIEPSLTDAVRDNELEMERWMFKPSIDDLTPYIADEKERLMALKKGTAVATRRSSDFWMFCLSLHFHGWMFDDFDADACLVVHEPIVFRDLLLVGVGSAINAKAQTFSTVTYVDPLTQFEDGVPVAFQKHARHSYQDEIRAAWQPAADKNPLQPIVVEIGSLESIAEIIAIT